MTGSGRVLIVEDHGEVAEAFTALLESEGYVVSQASNGCEALALLAGDRGIGVIVLDIMMPDMDGWAFREAQMADDELAKIPVIVVSAAGLPEEKKVIKLGMPFFRKPVVDLNALLSAICEHCCASSAAAI